MKLLVVIILIAFLTVSCAGTGKMRWVRSELNQKQFEEDREECKQKIGEGWPPEVYGKNLEACLAEKGYEYKERVPSGNEFEGLSPLEKLGLGALYAVIFVSGAVLVILLSIPK